MATIARLNQVASQTPLTARKRLRSSDIQDVTPLKRRAYEGDNLERTPTKAQSTSRKSATRLRSRSTLPVSSPAPNQRGVDIYSVQESPAQSTRSRMLKEKPPEEKKVTKKKRILNRKGDKPSTNNEAFDKRRQSAFNPLTVTGVVLSTNDSPAKNTRARRELPLKKLDPNYVKAIPVDAELVREASPELGVDNDREVPFTSGQSGLSNDYVHSNNDSEQSGQQSDIQGSDHDNCVSNGEDRTVDHDKNTAHKNIAAGNESIGHRSSWRQTISKQDLNYIARQYDEGIRQERQKAKETVSESQRAASQPRLEKVKRTRRRSSVRPASQQEEVQEDRYADTDSAEENIDDVGTIQAQAEPVKRKSRTKMSEEERRAKKEAEAQRRQENAVETEQADIRKFDAYGTEFIKDIEDLVVQIGGSKEWSRIGAGAKTITAMVAKKETMDGATAQTLWKKLSALRNIFSGQEEASEDRVNHLISSLRAKSTWSTLTKNGEVKRGDTTIVDLYEQLIPQSVYMLKAQLRERFVAVHRVSWQELDTLTEIAISLCDVASDWQYKPTNLETGIRKQVRQNIRSNLVTVRKAIKDAVTLMDWREKQRRELERFSRRQEQKREEKLREWEMRNPQFHPHQTSKPAGSISSNRGSQEALEESEQAEMIDSANLQRSTSNPSRKVALPSALRRQPTEEIPAPDPNINWSEEENVALLNGLQMYLNDDRYTRIFRDSRFGRALKEKDVDQCMARAIFYQAGCHQILREKAENGDGSFDWLRNV